MAYPLPIAQMPEELIVRPTLIMDLAEGARALCEPDAVVVTAAREVYIYVWAECMTLSDRAVGGPPPRLVGEADNALGWTHRKFIEGSPAQALFRWTVAIQCLLPGRSYRVDVTRAVRGGHKWRPLLVDMAVRSHIDREIYLPVTDLTIDNGGEPERRSDAE